MEKKPELRRRGRPPSRPRSSGEQEDGLRVDAVERALSILEAFDAGAAAESRPRLSLSAVAAHTGLYPSTVQRLAASLIRYGYLHRDEDGAYRLGPSLLRLGILYRDSFNLADRIRPALAALTAETSETSAFFVRERQDRICLFRHHSSRMIRHHVEEGARLPLDRGASGHVLTAYLGGPSPKDAAVRAAGHAVSLGERDPEAAAVAAPVFGPEGFLGALSIGGLLHRFNEEVCAEMTVAVTRAAEALSITLGGRTQTAIHDVSMRRNDE
jgi:DNA-binding IclR family transcriptional regulator